jgi:hypothetical protein
MARKNKHGVDDILVPRDPRNGNIIEYTAPDDKEFSEYRVNANGTYVYDTVTGTYTIDVIPIKWEENIPFTTEIKLDFPERLRQNSSIELIDTQTKAKYLTTMKWLRYIWDNRDMKAGGIITSKWAFVRNGKRVNLIPID